MEERVRVNADEILEAMAEGWDVDVQHANVRGDLDIREVENWLGLDEDSRSPIGRYLAWAWVFLLPCCILIVSSIYMALLEILIVFTAPISRSCTTI